MSNRPILCYWDCRGRAQPIRTLLKYVGQDFQEKLYLMDENMTWANINDYTPWFKEKYTVGLDFPNLPYWMDGDIKLTQSIVILKYLARKHGLVGKDVVTLAQQEMVEQQLKDLSDSFFDTIDTQNDYETVKDNYMKALPHQLEMLSAYLADKEWFNGQLSYVDFFAYEVLDSQRLYSPSTFGKFPKLQAFLTRFEALPKIKQYHSSKEYKDWPFGDPMSHWGYYK